MFPLNSTSKIHTHLYVESLKICNFGAVFNFGNCAVQNSGGNTKCKSSSGVDREVDECDNPDGSLYAGLLPHRKRIFGN